MKKKLLDSGLEYQEKSDILEKIKKYLKNPRGYYHIVSVNPENVIISDENDMFKKIVREAQIKIIDGVGVVMAARLLKVPIGPRLAGVDLMEELLGMANKHSFRVMLIGGRVKIAERVINCQRGKFPEANFFGLTGINDITHPKPEEEREIFSIVAAQRPHFLFAAFGSPQQELWLYKHRHKLSGVVCMGVGGAFDFFSGLVPRAPKLIRNLGLEWLFRLLLQPWRLKRQLRLAKFVFLVLKERLIS